jgi:hypothetical protein
MVEFFYCVPWIGVVRYVLLAMPSFPDSHRNAANFLQNVARFGMESVHTKTVVSRQILTCGGGDGTRR